MPSQKRLDAYEFGLFAEDKVAQEYIKRGFVILENRWRLGHIEIDLIAQKDDVVTLIEVKARSGKDEDALSTVTVDKRKKMIKAADAYLKKLKGQLDYRFDIATVTGDMESYEIDIYEDAFVAADIF